MTNWDIVEETKNLFYMNKTALVFITALGQSEDAILFEKEARRLFNSDKIILEFFHEKHPDEKIVMRLKEHADNETPHFVTLDHTCKHPQIIAVTQLLGSTIPKEKIHYWNFKNEKLQSSMLRFRCFSKLLQQYGTEPVEVAA